MGFGAWAEQSSPRAASISMKLGGELKFGMNVNSLFCAHRTVPTDAVMGSLLLKSRLDPGSGFAIRLRRVPWAVREGFVRPQERIEECSRGLLRGFGEKGSHNRPLCSRHLASPRGAAPT